MIDRHNNAFGRKIGAEVLAEMKQKHGIGIQIIEETITATMAGDYGRPISWKWTMRRFQNWNIYSKEIFDRIEEKVLDMLVATLLLCKRSKNDNYPILNPYHPFIKDNPDFQNLPNY